MGVLRAAVVAGVIAALLYWRFDSGIVMAERAPRLTSMPLLGLSVIFALGAWAASKSGYPHRAPWFAGLAAGIGAYAVVRLVAF
jgi:hypothetical protein